MNFFFDNVDPLKIMCAMINNVYKIINTCEIKFGKQESNYPWFA